MIMSGRTDLSQAPQDPREPFSTAVPDELRRAAAATTDPATQESLRKNADAIELAQRRLNALSASGDDVIESHRAWVASQRRVYELPGWVVAVVLLAFAAFLVLVALKHHV